jgi:hypothetical protein
MPIDPFIGIPILATPLYLTAESDKKPLNLKTKTLMLVEPVKPVLPFGITPGHNGCRMSHRTSFVR